MQSIILIGDERLNMSLIKKLQHQESLKSYILKRAYVVEFSNGHLRYEFLPGLSSEYDEEELSRIPFANPRFVSIEYTSIDLVKKVLSSEPILDFTWVDNDNDLIARIDDFREQIDNNPKWDWRDHS